jgi:serine/threonine protein kinase
MAPPLSSQLAWVRDSRALHPAATPMPIHFGPYELSECIGRGGMAQVWKGKRRGCAGFEKQVVVKTILPNLVGDARFVRLFTDEARLSAQLLHTNIVRVHDFGFVGRQPFLELEYLVGLNLKELWERVTARGQRFPVPIAITLVTAICRGLAYAHSFVDDAGEHRPIIHRDVSPANVMICRDGSVKLLDFGLARLTRGETLHVEMFQGKIAYMSPEQMEKGNLDRRADVFGLGAVLHELLVGRRLFGAGDDAETLRRLTHAEIAPPSSLNLDVPAALDVITMRALMRDPDERYQSATEMLAELDDLSAHAASPKRMLAYLGSVGPEIFTTACDGCGQRLPWGIDCRTCKTLLDDDGGCELVEELEDAGAAERESIAPPPPPALRQQRPVPSAPRLRALAIASWRLWVLLSLLWAQLAPRVRHALKVRRLGRSAQQWWTSRRP